MTDHFRRQLRKLAYKYRITAWQISLVLLVVFLVGVCMYVFSAHTGSFNLIPSPPEIGLPVSTPR
jgi:hypothetical protein